MNRVTVRTLREKKEKGEKITGDGEEAPPEVLVLCLDQSRIEQADAIERLPPKGDVRGDGKRTRVAHRRLLPGLLAHGRIALHRGLRGKGENLASDTPDLIVRESGHERPQPAGGRDTVGVDEGDDLASAGDDSAIPCR